MTDPVTLTTGAIVAIAASKFIEGAGAKVGELVTGGTLKQAGTQVSKLWKLIKGKFAGNQRAEEALAKVEAGDASALTKLEVYLDDELAEDAGLKEALLAIVAEIRALEPAGSQSMLVDVEADEIKARDLRQTSTSAEAVNQEMLKGVKAKTIDLGNLTQES